MEKKEMIKMLAYGYVEDYQKDMRIYEALGKEGIYLAEVCNPYTKYIEKIFKKEVGKDFCEALCDFASDGVINLIEPKETVTNLDRLIEVYVGE